MQPILGQQQELHKSLFLTHTHTHTHTHTISVLLLWRILMNMITMTLCIKNLGLWYLWCNYPSSFPHLVPSSYRGPINVPGIGQAQSHLNFFRYWSPCFCPCITMDRSPVLTNIFGYYHPNELYLDHTVWNYELKPSSLAYNPLYSLGFLVIPMAYGRSQARAQIGAAVASLHHSHSNTDSEPALQPTPQFTAILYP